MKSLFFTAVLFIILSLNCFAYNDGAPISTYTPNPGAAVNTYGCDHTPAPINQGAYGGYNPTPAPSLSPTPQYGYGQSGYGGYDSGSSSGYGSSGSYGGSSGY